MITAFRRALGAAGVFAALSFTSALAGAQSASEAAPEPTREQCLSAHHKAQELKQNRHFVEAQEHLMICSSGSCPGAVISDCGSWIGELEQVTPSMVFEILLDGKEAMGAKLYVDDKLVEDRSHAVKVNPGRHVIRAELEPYAPHEQDVVLPEGQRMRLISVQFKSKAPAPAAAVASIPPPPPKESARPTPGIVYPLLGAGVLGLGGFGVFSMLGKSKQSDLEDECEPACTDEDLRPMKRLYLIGDISGGVGVAALLGAAIVYFARPTSEVGSVSVGPVGLGGKHGSFGISATRAW